MYRKSIQRLTHGIIVTEYHSARYGAPGEKREKKSRPTPEQVEKINQKGREKKAQAKLMEHFNADDYFSTLTYRIEERPKDMDQALKEFKSFISAVRREYKKRGYDLKWMRNIEVGTRGAWHVHLVINRIPDTDIILKKAWSHGKAENQLLYEQGGFRKLAAYITKTPKTDKRLADARYSASRNLPLPAPEVKTYTHWNTWKVIHIPSGYYVDKDSFYEGVNPVTGYPYRSYTLLRLGGSMSQSIIEDKNVKECYICGARRNLHVHHIFEGTARRKKSEAYGLKVHLCMSCHEKIHAHPNQGDDLALKKLAQEIFEEHYSHKLFMAEFSKNYL